MRELKKPTERTHLSVSYADHPHITSLSTVKSIKGTPANSAALDFHSAIDRQKEMTLALKR